MLTVVSHIMSYIWNKTELWKAMCKEEDCPVCKDEPSPEEIVTILETDASWVEAHPNVALKRTCYVLSKKHAVELFDLSDEDAFAFIKDVVQTARALKEVTGAIEINYEIHGNTIPHLHMHLFPRYEKNDRFENGPIDPRITDPHAYKRDEFNQFIKDMKRLLT